MHKVAFAGRLGLLMFFTYLTAIRPAYAFAYALCLLGLVAWVWPRLAIRGISLTRKLDPGSPTVGESYEETIEVRRVGGGAAPGGESLRRAQLPAHHPGRLRAVVRVPSGLSMRGVCR